MKRSEALAPLSRDHQVALDAALFLKRATAETAAAALERFRAFYARFGDRHFDIEEQLLLPAVTASNAEWAQGSERMRREHADLRERGATASASDLDSLHELGARLHDHVRFEERELFPLAEALLADDELEALGQEIARAEAL